MVPYQVVLFLKLVREARASGRLSYRRNRDKNFDTLTELGWMPSEMLDRNPGFPDERVCEFGMSAEDKGVYVKIAVVGLEDGTAGCVVSFHFAEKSLVFPFGS